MSTLGSPMEARTLGYEYADPALDRGIFVCTLVSSLMAYAGTSTLTDTSIQIQTQRGASAIKCWWLPRNPLAC